MSVAERKKKAVFFCLTKNLTFALASVLMDIKRYSPKLAEIALVYHDGIDDKDKIIINSIFPARFIEYNFPISNIDRFSRTVRHYFSTMVFAKYEPLRLLDEFSTITLLDYDIVIQSDISEVIEPCSAGIKVLDSDAMVESGLTEYLGGYDLKKKTFCASLMVFFDNLTNAGELYDWCNKKTEDLAPYLYLPEQAIYDLLFQEFDIQPVRITDFTSYCCHPESAQKSVIDAKILHAYGKKKFWNGITSEQWLKNYAEWLRLGGSGYVDVKGKKKGKRTILKEKVAENLKKISAICTRRKGMPPHGLHYEHFSSKQYEVNSWTLNQCKNFGKEFEEKFFSKNFVNDFGYLLAGLDEKNSETVKFLFLRMLVLSFMEKKSLYTTKEKELFWVQENMKKNIVHEGTFCTYNGIIFKNGHFTLHNFLNDMGLKLLGKVSFPVDGIAIDVGAYTGDSSFILANYVKESVCAFEPLDETYALLKENVKLNKMEDRVIPEKICLSDRIGKINLHYAPGNLSISTNDPEKSLSKGGKYEEEKVDCVTIDSYIEKKRLKVGVIKIDAEGAESKVLAGAKKTILSDRPILLISIYHNIDDFLYIKPWVDSLDMDYKFIVNKPENTTFIEETMLVCY